MYFEIENCEVKLSHSQLANERQFAYSFDIRFILILSLNHEFKNVCDFLNEKISNLAKNKTPDNTVNRVDISRWPKELTRNYLFLTKRERTTYPNNIKNVPAFLIEKCGIEIYSSSVASTVQ